MRGRPYDPSVGISHGRRCRGIKISRVTELTEHAIRQVLARAARGLCAALVLMITIASTAVSSSAQGASGLYGAPALYSSGGPKPTNVVVADVNGDGKPDIVVANYGCTAVGSCQMGTIGVLLANGNGTFQPAVTYSSGGYVTTSVAVADVNHDGTLDLVVANFCGGGIPVAYNGSTECTSSGTIGVLLGNGDGTFKPVVTYSSGGYAWAISIADTNGDGKPDVLVAGLASFSAATNFGCNPGYCASVGVLLGDGNGSFTFQANYSVGSSQLGSVSMAVADINGDGRKDVVVGNVCAGSSTTTPGASNCADATASVLLGNADGTFRAGATYDLAGPYYPQVRLADMNGDGKADLIVNRSCLVAGCPTGELSVWAGNGDGSFQTFALDNYYHNIFTFTVGDFNGDGKQDLALVDYTCIDPQSCPNTVATVMLGNGDGTLQSGVSYDIGVSSPTSIASAVLNSAAPSVVVSGCNDTACAEGVVSILLSAGPPALVPVATVSPTSMAFPNQAVNTTSGAITVTVTDTGSAPLIITGSPSIGGTNSADFSVASGTTCLGGAKVSAGSSCAIQLTFTPSVAVPESATLSISDNAATSPQTVGLSGTGMVPSVSPPTITNVNPSQTFLGAQVSPFIITGANFQAGATISFSGSSLAVEPSSVTVAPNQIEVGLTVSSEATAGPYSVTVTNPDGGTTTLTAALNVLVVPPVPEGLSAVVGNQIVHLQWSGEQSVPNGYNVYVNGVLANSSGPIQNSGFGVTGLQNGQIYQFDVTAVGSGGESGRATVFAEPNAFVVPPHPLHPILFLHGINTDATAWETTTDFLTGTLGWTCGGTLAYLPPDNPNIDPPRDAYFSSNPALLSPTACKRPFSATRDFFVVDFGDNLANYPDDQGIFHQGDEVGGFIRKINTAKKLSIVAWSMGGLAARSYMQVTDPIDAPNQISDLITLGTPDWGVNGDDPEVIDLVATFEGINFVTSRGAFDMNGGCAANGDYGATQYLSQFLQSLDVEPTFGLPTSARYVVVTGLGGPVPYFNVACDRPLEKIPTDEIVPTTSSTLAGIVPSSNSWLQLNTADVHTALPDDVSAILCAIDESCLKLQVMSPVYIEVTAPDGLEISNSFTSTPAADYTSTVDATGHEISTVLIPFPQGGQYKIAVTPKPGAQPTNSFTILQTQDGVTTTIAENMQIANIPPSGFQTTVKNGSTFAVNYGGSVQQPLTDDGNGHFLASLTITNQGNVTVDSTQITLANTKLGTASAISVSNSATSLAPGASATVTLTFPITSALSTTASAPLRITGEYSAGTLSGNWALTFRSVTLGASIVGEN